MKILQPIKRLAQATASVLGMSCARASRLVSESIDHRLTFHEWLGMKLHLAICAWCRRYQRQISWLHQTLGRYPLNETDKSGSISLNADDREKMKRALRKAEREGET